MSDRHELILHNIGFSFKNQITMEGRPAKVFEMQTSNGRTFEVALENNGTARLTKPNGTTKWLIEKTPAQLGSICRQTLEFYR